MIVLCCLSHPFGYEMECLARMFLPGAQMKVVDRPPEGETECVFTGIRPEGDGLRLEAWARLEGHPRAERADCLPGDARLGEQERRLGLLLYDLLEELTGIRPPWGILTGVRPVRLCRRWREEGLDDGAIRARLIGDYRVSPHKADLTLATGRAQEGILARNAPDCFSLYISIPFCPSRCLYCSFVSAAIDKMASLVPAYLDGLRREIAAIGRIAGEKGWRLSAVYLGGGTPTVLEAGQLKDLFEAVAGHFDLSHLMEYTVEAGRPDTITADKLAVMRAFGVDRVSVNPQSMEEGILRAIGRRHTPADVEESYRLVREMGFSWVNMDLIAGLPGDTAGSFDRTLGKVLAMKPENITLHTLTVKRASFLREREDAFAGSAPGLDSLLEQARLRFADSGYRPYYLYRQKGTVQNLENTGFALPGRESPYNIYSMEDCHTILAAGAGGVTKLCRSDGRMRRVFNFKYPGEYITRFDEILSRKTAIVEWSV